MRLFEITKNTPFDKTRVLSVISKCADEMGGEGRLFYGNCGAFAIALSKWMEETFTGASFGMLAPVVKYGDDVNEGDEIPLSETFVDFNHVFSIVSIGDTYLYFDGSGEVDKAKLKWWCKDTKKWYRETFGRVKGIAKIVFAVSSANDSDAINAIENGTDATFDWTDVYEVLRKVDQENIQKS